MALGTLTISTFLMIHAVVQGMRAPAAPEYGTYQWPVRGPVIRGFEPPSNPYGPGHRGIDIAAPFGSPMVAAQDGIVAFAGWIGGSLFISIDHPDGVRTSYSWLSSVNVTRGDSVSRGGLIGATGQGHPGMPPPHLHFGARIGAEYIDPMLLLEAGDVVGLIHLAPLEQGFPAMRPEWPPIAGSSFTPMPPLSPVPWRTRPIRVIAQSPDWRRERAPPLTAANRMAGPCGSSVSAGRPG
jgi:murein DD-endopeptidase MepM/ murein hydrolase activator NlpD